MKKREGSIKTRLGYSFMSIIIISIFIFIFLVSLFLKQYYYKGVEDILENQVNMSVNFYTQYFSDSSLQDNIIDNIVRPIKQVTHVAEKMAKGDLKVRGKKDNNDEVGRLTDTLNYMADELIKKERIKNEFLASVSHELRTPLTSIKGWAIILNDTDPKDEAIFRDGLRIIEKETERLSEMVEGLLDFSKLLSENIVLRMEKVKVTELIEYIKQQMMPMAQRNNIDFVVEYSENLPYISLDKNRMKQVLINVLDNAFKFTDQGGRIVFSTYEAGGHLIMEIEDNGCGISPQDLPNIKEKFYRGKNSKSSSGIGLSVSHEIIKRHNGRLEIESQQGLGTRVYIELPIV